MAHVRDLSEGVLSEGASIVVRATLVERAQHMEVAQYKRAGAVPRSSGQRAADVGNTFTCSV